MNGGSESRLTALVDGAPLPEEEARALWKAFSEHMDAHRGDMAGFAAKKGWASIAPEYRQGKAVLVAWTSAPPPPPPAPRPSPAKKKKRRRPKA